jgi:uncharacterized protein (DUF1697 family)
MNTTSYISMLRGINVSGRNIIKMDRLKSLYQSLGFDEVSTYIQSGNVMFSTKNQTPKVLEEMISSAIATAFGFEVPVMILDRNSLAQIIQNNPFSEDDDKDEAFFHVTFLADEPVSFDQEAILAKKQADEAIVFTPKAIYLYCPNGYGNTKLNNNFLEHQLNLKATTRNWKTTCMLLNISNGI